MGHLYHGYVKSPEGNELSNVFFDVFFFFETW
jgi:hypothetical protein